MILFFALLPAFTPAQDLPFAGIKPAMQKFVDDGDLAGAVTLVGNKDGILSHEAVGQRDLADKSPMRKDALFRIASMTKPITAIAIMILVDEGKLSPDDDVAKHLPEFANATLIGDKKPSRPLKIRDLLTHTGGLPNYPKEFAEIYMNRDRTLAETSKAVATQPLQFEPGSKWAYCCNSSRAASGPTATRASTRSAASSKSPPANRLKPSFRSASSTHCE